MIAGSAGGRLRTGQFLDYSVQEPGAYGARQNKQTNSQLFLGLLRAFGIEQASYGDPRYGTTPLTDILA